MYTKNIFQSQVFNLVHFLENKNIRTTHQSMDMLMSLLEEKHEHIRPLFCLIKVGDYFDKPVPQRTLYKALMELAPRLEMCSPLSAYVAANVIDLMSDCRNSNIYIPFENPIKLLGVGYHLVFRKDTRYKSSEELLLISHSLSFEGFHIKPTDKVMMVFTLQ